MIRVRFIKKHAYYYDKAGRKYKVLKRTPHTLKLWSYEDGHPVNAVVNRVMAMDMLPAVEANASDARKHDYATPVEVETAALRNGASLGACEVFRNATNTGWQVANGTAVYYG